MKKENLNLKCPDCGGDLHEVVASGPYGIKIKLDQCFNCGGIWFDGLELYPLPKDEIEKIDSVKLEKLQEDSCLGNGKKLCPKCGIDLENFKDYNFPESLEAEQCKKCGGIWMNRGEAVGFKEWQEKKKRSSAEPGKKDEAFQKNIKGLLESYRDNDMEKIGKIGKILSLKIDPISGRPLNKGDYGSGEYEKASQAVSTAINIVYLLLKLFLRI